MSRTSTNSRSRPHRSRSIAISTPAKCSEWRQPFNVVLPVFAGMMDTLAADLNDDLSLEMSSTIRPTTSPSQDQTPVGTGGQWFSPNARFAFKSRTDRSNALFTGVGFMMNFAVRTRSTATTSRPSNSKTQFSSRPVALSGKSTSMPAAKRHPLSLRSSGRRLRPEQVRKLLRRAPRTRPCRSNSEEQEDRSREVQGDGPQSHRCRLHRRASVQTRRDAHHHQG